MRNEHQRNQHNIFMESLTRKSSWEIVQNPFRPLSSSHTSRPRCRQAIPWWQVVVWWLVVIVIVLNLWCYGFKISKVSCVTFLVSLENNLCRTVVRNDEPSHRLIVMRHCSNIVRCVCFPCFPKAKNITSYLYTFCILLSLTTNHAGKAVLGQLGKFAITASFLMVYLSQNTQCM